jgi:HAD superfamily hydrolase (TIGR01509 family)
MMPQVLFFDLGWTLENENYSQLDRAIKVVSTCREFGISIPEETILELQDEGGKLGEPNVFKYALNHIGIAEEQIQEFLQTTTWNPSLLFLYKNVKNILQLLNQKNILGIIANQSKPVNDRLKKYGILNYFKTVISSCEAGQDKPDLGIFKLALTKIGTSGAEIWMIGDRIDNDIVPAKEIGWKTIRVLQGNHRMQQPITEFERADYTINQISEILSIFPY